MLFRSIGKILVDQIVGFMENLPSFWSSLERDLSAITEKLAGYFKFIPSEFEWDLVTLVNSGYLYFTDFIAKMTTPTVAAVGNFAKNLPSVLISVIMTLLSSYFFIAEREYLNKNVRAFFPLGVQKRWNMVFGNLKRAVGGYFKAQFKIELWIYLLLVIGLSLLEIKYAILIALGIACLDFLPVFGTGTVLIPLAIIKFLNADYKMAIWLLIIYAIGQLVRQIIQPKIVGDSIGVAPLPTLIFLFIVYKVERKRVV